MTQRYARCGAAQSSGVALVKMSHFALTQNLDYGWMWWG